VLPTLVARVNSYAFRSCPYGEGQGQVLYLNGQLVPLTLEEREHILGYPIGSTNPPGLSYSAKHHILGSCFDAFAVSHLFACAFALRFSMLCLSDSHLFSHVSELGGGQLDNNIPIDLTSLFDSGQEFLQLAAQQLLMSTGSASEWDLFIPCIAFGYRATPHESTKVKTCSSLNKDTPRYAKLRSGAYTPLLRKFKKGQFVYIKDHDSMHDTA
jgi:hypothetical protein